jgi:hydroxymethylglutaryl-CoA lyase
LKLPAEVTIYEVGPRDGLQNEARNVPTADKIRFIDALVASGIRADAAEVARGVARPPGVRMSALVPNRRGLDTALASGMKEVAVFLSASETHNKKNVNKTIDETLAAFDEVVPAALDAGIKVRAYLSTCFGCPYEGEVDPERVVSLVGRLADMGVYQVSVSDTIGVANPAQTEDVLSRVLAKQSVDKIAVHMHDTQGTALANVVVALQMGITTVDSAAGGLGGCPYAPGASGNLATEDVVAMLHSMGVATGIDLDKLTEASRTASTFVGHELPSKYLKAHLGKQARARRRAEKLGS